MLYMLTITLYSENNMKHKNTLWCSMYIFAVQKLWYIVTKELKGPITVDNYQKIFHKYCQELVKATLFQYFNKLNTAVDYCAL